MHHRAAFTHEALRWAKLLSLSLALAAGFEAIGLPAARFLGPMIAAIALAVRGSAVRMPRTAFVAAHGIIGCLIARGVPPSIASSLSERWPAFAYGTLAVTAIAYGLGWVLSRWQVLPGSTALWGAAPGSATAMVVMSQAHGADDRLVAFMQYLRVVCVSLSASMFAHWWISRGAEPAAAHHVPLVASLFAAPEHWSHVAWTLLLGFGGAALGIRLRIPSGALLVPMAGGIVLQGVGGFAIELPPLLLAVSYAVVGWTVGLRFDGAALKGAMRALPKVLASTLLLIALCGACSVVLVEFAHVDPLTAFLAMTPGGADTVAIIAASTPVDVAFVITMQVLRMLFITTAGPLIARRLASRLRRAVS